MKRILALHGVGSSATILRDQLAPLVTALSPDYEVVYLDGAIERDRGPGMCCFRCSGALPNMSRVGMAPYYPGPFYSYTTGYSPMEIRDALDDLDDFIHDNGPFDGVIGFSQGASMAASYLLHHHARQPNQRPPFAFAVFLSSVAAFSPDENHSLPIVQRLLRQLYPAVRDFPEGICKKLPQADAVFAKYLATTFKVARKIGAVLPGYDIAFFKPGGDPREVPRVVHPSLTTGRIAIPTVHFTGKTDHPAMVEQARVVCALCDQSVARVHQHAGGHGAPSRKGDVEMLAESMEWAVAESASRSALDGALNRLPVRGLL